MNNTLNEQADIATNDYLGRVTIPAESHTDILASAADAAADDYFGDNPQPQTTQTVLAQASKINPDFEAEWRKLATGLGVPVSVVKDDPEAAKRKAQLQAADIPQLAQKYPATNKFLADPQDAAVAHDDVDGLTGVEKALQVAKTTVRSIGRWPADMVSSNFAVWEGIAKFDAPAYDWTAGTLFPENPLRSAAKLFENVRKGATEVGNKIQGPLPTNAGFIERNLYNAATSLGQQIPAIGASLATANPWTGLAIMGLSQGGQSIADTLDKRVS